MMKISSERLLSSSTVRVVERRFDIPNTFSPAHSIPVYLSHIYQLELDVYLATCFYEALGHLDTLPRLFPVTEIA